LASGKLGKAAAFNRQKQILIKKKDEIFLKNDELVSINTSFEEKLKLLEEEKNDSIQYISKLKNQLKKLSDLEKNTTQQEELIVLKDLISLNESLRTQESTFKTTCKQQLQEMNNKLKSLENEEGGENEENKKFRDIEDMHEKVFFFIIIYIYIYLLFIIIIIFFKIKFHIYICIMFMHFFFFFF
jgi:hypothetical protein